MICFEHTTWADAMVLIVSGGTSDTWTYTTDYTTGNAPAASLRDFSTSFEAWLNDAGRPWATVFALTLIQDASRVAVQMAGNATFAVFPNAAFVAATGISAAILATTQHSGAGAATTSWPAAIALRQHIRWDKAAGVAAAAGAFLPSIPNTYPRRPSFRMLLTESDAIALTAAIASASNPRRAHLYHPSATAWHLAAIGKIRPPRRAGNLYRAALTVLA